MSNHDSNKVEAWAAKLAGNSADDQIDALRQISSEDAVTGVTISIVSLAGSSDDELRMWAAEALESAVQPDSSEVLMLMKMLETAADGEICYWSATMLGRLGDDAAPAAGALEACLRESMYLPARERATWALSEIGAAAKVAIPALKEAVETAPPRLQRLAAQTLEAIETVMDDASDSSEGTGEAAA